MQGIEIANRFTSVAQTDTTYQLLFDIANLSNGVYFAVFQYANVTTERT